MNTSDIIEHMTASPYPPSFQGSGWVYAFALFSLMLISTIGGFTVLLAMRNLVRQKLLSIDWWLHLAFTLAGVGASIRCAADAAYMMAWGETSIQTLELLLTIRNGVNGFIAAPVIAWMGIYTLKINTIQRSRHRTARFLLILAILGAISAIIAFSKV